MIIDCKLKKNTSIHQKNINRTEFSQIKEIIGRNGHNRSPF